MLPWTSALRLGSHRAEGLQASAMPRWKLFSPNRPSRQAEEGASRASSDDDVENGSMKPPRWSFGVLNDKQTDEVPGKSDQLP